MKLSALKILSTLVLGISISSCTKSGLEDAKDAQTCLNTATMATAQSCVSKLSGDDSERANQLKCAADFIEQGFGDPAKVISAINAAKDQSSNCPTCSDSLSIIAQFKFTNSTKSQNAVTVCEKSGVKVYSLLSSFAHLSTLAKEATSIGDSTDPLANAAAINEISPAQLGSLIQTTYSSSCSSSSSTSDTADPSALQKACSDIKSAIASGDDTAIGQCLQYKLTGSYQSSPGVVVPGNPGAPCPNN